MGGSSWILLGYKSSLMSWVRPNEKAFLSRIWNDFDTCHMKPLLIRSRLTWSVCCTLLATLLTKAQQLSQEELNNVKRADSDSFLASLWQCDRVERREGAGDCNTESQLR
ncbi:hypothetical protein KQX54_000105 [Cotesia glomerata]|uniref:Uncharacterized protein n=1 Tax=Cotesia glomerata TaxID=32391 RepID=A0AAV7II44_COTGL|nr:hypothetical protein KQX54_000105 [Cotesia glomerata]